MTERGGAVRLPSPPLLLITDRRQAVRPLDAVVDAALAAGARWISIREKDLSKSEQLSAAKRLLPVARRRGAVLLLHGDAEIAAVAGLDGVHLGAGGDPVAARRRLGEGALIGQSIHAPIEAMRLDPAVVDYAIAGPAFPTVSKPGYGPALGPAGIAAMVESAAVPVLAIGGVTAARVPALMAVGAAGVAVMGEVMRAADPAAVVGGLLAALAVARR
ncbi:Thiamine-phosphate synthase [Rhodoplanes serenus]|uniref:Thiamine-phosphate synthase n=1 Tax=Rhodoplanes serenus TaxID=200615 RepID=A0A3S4B3V8_9BRAD|nr:thiamine phosphate synthase [Rhodoplanes serenus]VCU11014.1 Thiamine-phosphate synthase [Rhodoplanes serenus]